MKTLERENIQQNKEFGINWSAVLTASTPKGRVAQLVNLFSRIKPEKIVSKRVFDASDIGGIEDALNQGLEMGFSCGIATCFTSTKVMESAPYWVGRIGVHKPDDIKAVIEGDPNWRYFGSRVPVGERGKYNWTEGGLKGLLNNYPTPKEVVVNYQPEGFAIKPEKHCAVNMYLLPRESNIHQRNLYIAIAPGTYNTRALSGRMQMEKSIILIYRQGNIYQPRNPTIMLVGRDLFDPAAFEYLEKVSLNIRELYSKAFSEMTPKLANFFSGQTSNPPSLTDFFSQNITNLADLVVKISRESIPNFNPDKLNLLQKYKAQRLRDLLRQIIIISGKFPDILTNLVDPGYAITGFNSKAYYADPDIALPFSSSAGQIRKLTSSPLELSPIETSEIMLLIKDLIDPNIMRLINEVNATLTGKDYELWRSILELLEGELNGYFEPTLEFIGGPGGLQLYEVKEKPGKLFR